MCHFNYPVITGLAYFPQLTRLCILAQDIKEIRGLEACHNLRSLWIAETLITEITGLDALKCLYELYLYYNLYVDMEIA
jgi:hypothetical protein